MKTPISILLLLLSFVAFAQKEQKDPYLGLSKSQILAWFGEPETKESNARGEILTFRRVRKHEWTKRMPIDPSHPMLDKIGTVKRIDLFRFSFDKKGVVSSWKVDTLR